MENLLGWIWRVTKKLLASHKGLYSTGLDKGEVIPIPHFQVMKVYIRGVEIKFQLLSTLASCSSPLIPAEITLDTNSVGHWLDSRASLGMMAKRKSALTKIQTVVTQSVTSKFTDWAILIKHIHSGFPLFHCLVPKFLNDPAFNLPGMFENFNHLVSRIFMLQILNLYIFSCIFLFISFTVYEFYKYVLKPYLKLCNHGYIM